MYHYWYLISTFIIKINANLTTLKRILDQLRLWTFPFKFLEEGNELQFSIWIWNIPATYIFPCCQKLPSVDYRLRYVIEFFYSISLCCHFFRGKQKRSVRNFCTDIHACRILLLLNQMVNFVFFYFYQRNRSLDRADVSFSESIFTGKPRGNRYAKVICE